MAYLVEKIDRRDPNGYPDPERQECATAAEAAMVYDSLSGTGRELEAETATLLRNGIVVCYQDPETDIEVIARRT